MGGKDKTGTHPRLQVEGERPVDCGASIQKDKTGLFLDVRIHRKIQRGFGNFGNSPSCWPCLTCWLGSRQIPVSMGSRDRAIGNPGIFAWLRRLAVGVATAGRPAYCLDFCSCRPICRPNRTDYIRLFPSQSVYFRILILGKKRPVTLR